MNEFIDSLLVDPVKIATPFFFLLVLLEMAWVKRGGRGEFEPNDTATSMLMGIGNLVTTVAGAFITITAYLWAWQFRPFDIGYAWWAWIICFVADDFLYYVFHRAAHRVRWFWASHVIHHSSQHYNLSTALRQTWTNTLSVSFIFRMPLFLIGFEPAMIIFCAGLNLVYQFWIHTESIDRMGRFMEGIMNTPSHHRVHHATNPRYLDSNYAGVFIVWDRMFGTFVEETAEDPPRYGIIQNLGTFNPLKVAFHEWIAMGSDIWRAKGLGDRMRFFLAPPGWTPDGSRQTTDMIKADWRARESHAHQQRLSGGAAE